MSKNISSIRTIGTNLQIIKLKNPEIHKTPSQPVDIDDCAKHMNHYQYLYTLKGDRYAQSHKHEGSGSPPSPPSALGFLAVASGASSDVGCCECVGVVPAGIGSGMTKW